jgi:hypothetical protein
MTMNYKVGDRVKFLRNVGGSDDAFCYHKGDIATITRAILLL